MARSIPTDALAKLATQHGTESILIVAVQWVAGGSFILYADRAIEGEPTVKPAILELGTFDSILAVTLNETSQEVEVLLDDTDGTIKTIIDTHDIHKRDVVIYQWFPGIPFESKFIVFRGKINSPISWKESDRTVSFAVLSQLEDNEIGYTPEEGEFPNDIMDDLLGKPWPECFGTSVHQVALKMDRKHQGSLGDSFGIADFTLRATIEAHNQIANYLLAVQVYWAYAEAYLRTIGAEEAADQANATQLQIAQQRGAALAERDKVSQTLADQLATERTHFRVIGGETFPRGTLTLNVNDALVTGNFGSGSNDDRFYATETVHPDRDEWPLVSFIIDGIDFGTLGTTLKSFPYAESFLAGDNDIYTGKILGEQAGPFYAAVGTSVNMASNEPIRYVVSITPGYGGQNGTGVLKCAAFTTFESGERVLMDIPTSYYRSYRQSFGSVTATIVEMHDAISKVDRQPWEDTVYVTFQSSIGPNPVDVIAYLITRYTSFGIDEASFDHVRERLVNYPMNFVFPGRKNIFTALQELTFQARCAIYLRNGFFYLQYLPEAQASVHTFNESNVDTNTLELGFTATEDLITKFVGTWRAHGAQDEDNKCILRYNIKKYGTQEFAFDFYAYSLIDIVLKVMSYWLVRRGNTWKTLSYSASLDALNAEVFDGVTLDFVADYASYDAVLGMVEQADYDSDQNTVNFTVWTGVRAGEMVPYDFAYPADISELLVFPDAIEEAEGYAGGGGIGQDTSGWLNRKGVERGGLNVTYNGEVDPFGFGDVERGYRKNSDKGGQKPSDQGDGDPGSPVVRDTGTTDQGPIPPPSRIISSTFVDQGTLASIIDIRKTSIIDSDFPGQSSVLATFFKQIKNGSLMGDTEAQWMDDDNEGTFHFKWDTDDSEWGAGTAFLED
jgi:hypothetical protein